MVAPEDGLRKQDGDVAVEGRGVLQVGNEFAALAENGLAHDIVHVRHGEFHLAVDARLPGVAAFGIVPTAVLRQIVQEGAEEDVVADLESRIRIRYQGEVHFAVGPARDREGLGDIADDGGRSRVTGVLPFRLQGIGARIVGGRAGHRPFEIDRGKGEALSRRCIRHLARHPCGLGISPEGCEKERQQRYETDSRHKPPNILTFLISPKKTSCTEGPAATVWPSRAGSGRGIRRRRSRSWE